jgi:hypothetical protein
MRILAGMVRGFRQFLPGRRHGSVPRRPLAEPPHARRADVGEAAARSGGARCPPQITTGASWCAVGSAEIAPNLIDCPQEVPVVTRDPALDLLQASIRNPHSTPALLCVYPGFSSPAQYQIPIDESVYLAIQNAIRIRCLVLGPMILDHSVGMKHIGPDLTSPGYIQF